MVVGFGSNPQVTAIVTAIQQAFESFPERRENFGPAFKKKLGQPFQCIRAQRSHTSIGKRLGLVPQQRLTNTCTGAARANFARPGQRDTSHSEEQVCNLDSKTLDNANPIGV
jgi:hypothetical protein